MDFVPFVIFKEIFSYLFKGRLLVFVPSLLDFLAGEMWQYIRYRSRYCAYGLASVIRVTVPQPSHSGDYSVKGKADTYRCSLGKERQCVQVELKKIIILHQVFFQAKHLHGILINSSSTHFLPMTAAIIYLKNSFNGKIEILRSNLKFYVCLPAILYRTGCQPLANFTQPETQEPVAFYSMGGTK